MSDEDERPLWLRDGNGGPDPVCDERWAEALARVSEGRCARCGCALRALDPAEQAAADTWHDEPFAVCTICEAIMCRARDGDDRERDEPEVRRLSGYAWTSDGRPPFTPPRR